MKPISNRYERLFREFYAKKAKDRFDFIITYSNHFTSSLPFVDKLLCEVDTVAIDALVTSYFLDVIKFKEYHFRESSSSLLVAPPVGFLSEETTVSEWVMHHGKLLNASKIGAFTAKWLLKYRPVSIIPKKGASLDLFERRHLQNAPFWLAANITLRSMSLLPEKIPPTIYRNLIYHLRFREFHDRSMMLYFELLIEHIESVSRGTDK